MPNSFSSRLILLFTFVLTIALGFWIAFRQQILDLPLEPPPEEQEIASDQGDLSDAARIAALQGEFEALKKRVEAEPVKSRKQIDKFLAKTGPNHQVLQLLSESYAIETRNARSVDEQADICEVQIRHFTKISQQYPQWSELLYRLASQRLVYQRLRPELMEELDAAAEELERVVLLGLWEDNVFEEASGYFQLGRTYKHQGDTYKTTNKGHLVAERYQVALEAFEKTLELSPDRIDALGEIILIYLADGNVNQATQAVRQHMPLIEKPNLRGKMLEMLGALLQRNNDAAGAEEAFLEGLEHNPRLMGSYLHLAAIYQTQSQYDKAESILQRSIAAESRFLEGHFALGNLFQGFRRFSEAIRAYEELLKIPKEDAIYTGMLPSHVLYRNNLYYMAAEKLAALQLQEGNQKQALETAREAATHQAVQAPLADLMGRIYLAQSKLDEAAEQFKEAIRLDNLPDAHLHLAQVYLKQNKTNLARNHLSSALAAEQDFADREEAQKLLQEIPD